MVIYVIEFVWLRLYFALVVLLNDLTDYIKIVIELNYDVIEKRVDKNHY